MRLRFFPWSEVRKLIKLRARHPLGYNIEFVKIFRQHTPAAGLQQRNQVTPPSANAVDATGGWLKMLPRNEIWLPSYVDHKSFQMACDMLSDYARRYRIPMEFWDITPAGKQNTVQEGSGGGKLGVVGIPVDQL